MKSCLSLSIGLLGFFRILLNDLKQYILKLVEQAIYLSNDVHILYNKMFSVKNLIILFYYAIFIPM